MAGDSVPAGGPRPGEAGEVRETTSGEATQAAGAELAGRLAPGDVVLISGELGAGKTTFVRGALAALGVTEPVTSPTFVLGHLYTAEDGRGYAHLDLYRLDGAHDEDPGLLDPYFGPELVTFVEWPERAPWSGEAAASVRLEHAGGDRRRITVRRPAGS